MRLPQTDPFGPSSMKLFKQISRCLFLCLAVGSLASIAAAQNVKRIVIVKIDGLPGYYVDKFVKQRDPSTGRSELPWIEEAFYRNGTRLRNFYTRGMSLSGPSWGQLDTGRHLQIKGNVEYDRYTLHTYDYLNFFPYYISYGLSKKVDMPAVEVMDQLQMPILSDAFPFENKYTSHQLYQRGNDWAVLASGFVKLYPGDPTDFINEWTIGLNFRSMTIRQAERDIVGKLVKRDDIDYYDYYDTEFDHISHHNNDTDTRLAGLKRLDQVIGNLWTAIQRSNRADETALVLVSDHGFNSAEKVISQGFNIVKMLGSPEGGSHHVVTKRRLMLDYSVKGLYPLTPIVKTASPTSNYLKGQSEAYPTALVDFDGNERSSIHLRNSDLNVLHTLLQQIRGRKLKPDVHAAAVRSFFRLLRDRSTLWRNTARELTEEIDALGRWADAQEKILPPQRVKASETVSRGEAESHRRTVEQIRIARDTVRHSREYIRTLNNLLALDEKSFRAGKWEIKDLIAPGAMGDPNTLFQLQNYVVGLSSRGLVLSENQEIDLEKSFARVDYFELLNSRRVRNNVQAALSNRPVDFVALRIPLDSLPKEVGSGSTEDPIWLYGDLQHQALLLSRTDTDGVKSYRYLPIAALRQDENGAVIFQSKELTAGFPLRLFEDPDLDVQSRDRRQWLGEWHTESEWMRATHRTTYSNAVLGLSEHIQSHPLFDASEDPQLSHDERLIRRFRQRQRHLTEADMLVVAKNHWNFDVRGFNPGGNHGSFLRVSTNSTFMIAGGARTGIPRGREIDEPYDNLSFAPTILKLMGKVDENNEPVPELKKLGFRRFPGRVITELAGPGSGPRDATGK
jgi:hypothetical protein